MSGVLEDRVMIVTGAAGGIGEGYTHAISAAGAKVIAADLDEGGAERVADAVRGAGGEATTVCVDIASNESCMAMAPATL
ncbi:MAG: SDR family NAD(P)-dependent oxidoreductase, partial [Myxococcota bacterium]